MTMGSESVDLACVSDCKVKLMFTSHSICRRINLIERDGGPTVLGVNAKSVQVS